MQSSTAIETVADGAGVLGYCASRAENTASFLLSQPVERRTLGIDGVLDTLSLTIDTGVGIGSRENVTKLLTEALYLVQDLSIDLFSGETIYKSAEKFLISYQKGMEFVLGERYTTH
ncbi:hypothetical protein HY638_00820 [Candidatus Woesearchaeota archaeon]|nr:hypothetical protein [Candidatus Woesearchaeota archaeon]